jgi:hypothetical protein
VGTNANVAGTLAVTGVATFSAAPIYSSLTASSAVATDASKALVSVTNTGTGNNVLATSPTLVTPILGTPQSGTLTNCTGLPTTALTGAITEANGGTGTTVGYNGFKNRLINSAMVIDQRNAGASVTAASGNNYNPDRWNVFNSVTSKTSVQQVTDAPTGFVKSQKITSLAATTAGANDYYFTCQRIEGFNVADFGWGTASAATVTLSFWVKSSLTGSFSGAFGNDSFNRSYPFSYTISAANTWEQKTVTVAGDTTGTWATDNSTGIQVVFDLGSGSSRAGAANVWSANDYRKVTGSVSVVGTSGATFYITGVQLEKGSTATSFDYRPYGTELALCQRYFQKVTGMMGSGQATTTVSSVINFSVEMRASPTLSLSAAAKFSDFTTADYTQSSASAVINSGTRVTPQGVFVNFGNFTGLTLNRPIGMIPNESGILLISSEL